MALNTETREHVAKLCSKLKLDNKAEELIRILKSLGNERRLRIVCALAEKECSVSELGTVIEASQSLLSQHLAVLRRNGLVTARRCAQRVYYSLSPATEREIRSLLRDFFQTDAAGDSDANEADGSSRVP